MAPIKPKLPIKLPEVKSSIDAIIQRCEKHGLALMLLLGGLFWAKPHVDELIVDLRSHLGKLTVAVESQALTQARQAELQSVSLQRLDKIENVSTDTNIVVKELKGKIVAKKPLPGNDTAVVKAPNDPASTPVEN